MGSTPRVFLYLFLCTILLICLFFACFCFSNTIDSQANFFYFPQILMNLCSSLFRSRCSKLWKHIPLQVLVVLKSRQRVISSLWHLVYSHQVNYDYTMLSGNQNSSCVAVLSSQTSASLINCLIQYEGGASQLAKRLLLYCIVQQRKYDFGIEDPVLLSLITFMNKSYLLPSFRDIYNSAKLETKHILSKKLLARLLSKGMTQHDLDTIRRHQDPKESDCESYSVKMKPTTENQ